MQCTLFILLIIFYYYVLSMDDRRSIECIYCSIYCEEAFDQKRFESDTPSQAHYYRGFK